MKWVKKGIIFTPTSQQYPWMHSHAQGPTVDWVNDEVIRVYFGTRDEHNRSRIACVDLKAEDPSEIVYVHDRPVMDLGALGCFDDAGLGPSWVVNHQDKKYLYYIGVNTSTTVPYRNAIGLAVSEDDGYSFQRLYEGPVMGKNHMEPYFTSTPCIHIERDVWRMWYQSTVKWELYNGKPEPFYHIKYAESRDGVHWDRQGSVMIDFASPDECAITRPCVIVEDGVYKMWYAYRGLADYRTSAAQSYRIGYAESPDGLSWERQDEKGLDISEEGWDANMTAYPFVYRFKDKLYMLYNGNDFGKDGFGYATEAN